MEWTYNNLTKKIGLAECLRDYFYMTTSRNFLPPALLYTVMSVGGDRAADWPVN